MKILQSNNKYILVSSQQDQIYLINAQTFKISHKKQFSNKTKIKIGSLQYGTGIAALAIGSMIYIYDFLYERQIYTFDSYKPIQKLLIRKNLLIIVSEFRILIHNLQKKQNVSYIQTINGKALFFNENFYRLSIFYPQTTQKLISKEIWKQKAQNIFGVKYYFGCYFDQNIIALSLQNVLSFYQQGQLIKVYGFDQKIIQMKSNLNSQYMFILLQNGQIIGLNLTEQFKYQIEEIQQNDFRIISAHKELNNEKYYQMWIEGDFIYLWKNQINQIGKLFKALIKNGIKVKFDESRLSKAYSQKQIEKNLPFQNQLSQKEQSLNQNVILDIQNQEIKQKQQN